MSEDNFKCYLEDDDNYFKYKHDIRTIQDFRSMSSRRYLKELIPNLDETECDNVIGMLVEYE